MNRVILIGNLGCAPEMRYTADGVACARFRLATNEILKDRDGNPKEHTEWHRIVAWGELAETCGKYLTKGKPVYLEGRLHTRSWEQNGLRLSKTEVVMQTMKMLGNQSCQQEMFGQPEVSHGDTPAFN